MRIVLLASGSGTLTQAVIDAFAAGTRGVEILAVGSDSSTAGVLDRARAHDVATFVVRPKDFADRQACNEQLRRTVAELGPDWVVSAGFMRILGPSFVEAFSNRIINTHPALLPSFPGAHGVRDALAHGVKLTGGTIHLVDTGVDTGPIITQYAVPIGDDDTEETVHERIKALEREELVRLLAHLAHSDLVIDGRHVRGYAASATAAN
ncbi:phosphoribosylglycinamide formyltransferase [Brevibacterium sp.]|uniref:phosphoribosylglycinamide formyltransferase n=1 Tax=Brevibacterium sp. TaxID=1701 RepID=UPI002616606E|nr:phosphoribosylglycinamide formyltransferase [Brevibacterium sp.]